MNDNLQVESWYQRDLAERSPEPGAAMLWTMAGAAVALILLVIGGLVWVARAVLMAWGH
jgi:hypothetical protein